MGGDDDPQAVWGDLRVALASIAAYAPGVDVVVGWNGREEPRGLPDNPCLRLLRQAPGIRTGSEAWNWCATQTNADELLILGDDCVLLPDSLPLLLQDVETIRRQVPDDQIGFVGARSNYVKGPQNVRNPNGASSLGIKFDTESQILKVDMVVPVAAWIRHEVFDLTEGFPRTNWFADDVMCWDLRHLGFNHYVSRAYVHHVGERATGEGKSSAVLLEEGLAWLRANRSDYLAEMLPGVPA
jgi:hypothetical protein